MYEHTHTHTVYSLLLQWLVSQLCEGVTAGFMTIFKMSWQPPYHGSKFRHVYGKPACKGQNYDGLPITRGVHDNHCCAVNPCFIAVVTECAGGGAFTVISIRHVSVILIVQNHNEGQQSDVINNAPVCVCVCVLQKGRVDPHHPRVCGHSARVLDVKWDPFDDQRIASCSEDCTVKVWQIPCNGLKGNLIKPQKELLGHVRRVGLIEWHPTAKDILLSSAYDYRVCIDTDTHTYTQRLSSLYTYSGVSLCCVCVLQVCVWRVDHVGVVVVKTPVCVIHTHTDLVMSVSFSEDGSRIATTCRDRRVRVLEPRTGHTLQESCNESHKAFKVLFLSNRNLLLTTGTSKWNQRQFALWDPDDLSEPLLEEDVDGGSGVLFPFYDPDTHILYLAGKGDGNIRYYEVSSEKPYIHFLAEYRSPLPHKGLGVMPKRGLNTVQCEVFRFYRLVTVKDLVEPLSFIVPRKSEDFQEDIYPMTASNEAAMTAQEWLMGQNKGPLLMCLRPETKVQNPYPAPEQDTERPACSLDLLQENYRAEKSANEKAGYDIVDLSEWQEDETQWNSWTDRCFGVRWCESVAYTPPAVDKEQQEEIRSLRQQLCQRDSRIQQLELEIKNIRNQLRASF
ncbi:coronin-2B isoform X2 [Hemibagrus wyckioides]|uniref:coronin-2B isoform X2 n=1 Tax=Hemibagrus wyckioides TaxID=337641 RepID=UPI00266C6021|nr:coronin-2B isoform X2 [Hemibagrus wyckioides]